MDSDKIYSVYLHKCPDGMVYVGMSKNPKRRWQNGRGYMNTPFYDAVEKWGWWNIEHKIVKDNLDRDKAKQLESNLIYATNPKMSFNRVVGDNTEIYTMEYAEYREFVKLVLNNLGKSANTDLRLLYAPTTEREILETLSPLLSCFDGKEEVESKVEKPNQPKTKDMRKEKQKKGKERTYKGVGVAVVLDTRYRHNNGGFPVSIRIYHKSKYKYIRTGYVMTTDEFSDMNQKDEKMINDIFEHYVNQVRDCVERGYFNINATLKEYTPLSSVGGTLADLIKEKMGMLDNKGSARNYINALNKVYQLFPDGMPLCDVSPTTIGRYKDLLVREGKSNTTINIYLSVVKASINYGIYRGYIKPVQYPFKRAAAEIDKVSMPKANKRDLNYLLKDDIKKIWDYFMTSKKPSKELGYFLFSYLHGGMNLADMMFLKFDDFYFNERGFCFKRRKTMKKNSFNVVVPVTSWTDMLFKRLGIVPELGKCVFKDIQCDGSDSEYQRVKANHATYINRVLEKVCEKVGIRTVSMTTARHSFATVATKEKMQYTLVEQAMGHANNSVSSHYIGGWDVDEMRCEFERLLA